MAKMIEMEKAVEVVKAFFTECIEKREKGSEAVDESAEIIKRLENAASDLDDRLAILAKHLWDWGDDRYLKAETQNDENAEYNWEHDFLEDEEDKKEKVEAKAAYKAGYKKGVDSIWLDITLGLEDQLLQQLMKDAEDWGEV